MRVPVVLSLIAALAIAVSNSGCGDTSSKEIQVAVTEEGFVPKAVKIRKGQLAVLVVTRRTEHTCATEAIFRETGRKYDLPFDQPVRVDLTGITPGTLHYSCGMDMYKGTVTIE